VRGPSATVMTRGTTSRPRSSTPSSTTCRGSGRSAGRSGPTWR